LETREGIPTKKTEMDRYIENPKTNKRNKLIFKIFIVSKIPKEELLEDETLKEWLRNKRTSMYLTTLKSSKPMFAGFFDEPNPERTKTGFLEQRIQRQLKDEELDFEVIVKPIFVEGFGNSSLVYMVMTNSKDVSTIRKKLKEVRTYMHKFYSWDEYADLSKLQKLHIIKEQQHSNKNHRCMLIDGFKTTVDIGNGENGDLNDEHETALNQEGDEMNISATSSTREDEDTQEDEDIETGEWILKPNQIYQYIEKTYLQQDGNSMINGITGPVGGVIQVWYMVKQQNQTLSLLNVIKVEIARKMTRKCLQATFKDHKQINQQTMTTPAWRPNQLLLTTPVAEPQKEDNRRHRQRYGSGMNQTIYISNEGKTCQDTEKILEYNTENRTIGNSTRNEPSRVSWVNQKGGNNQPENQIMTTKKANLWHESEYLKKHCEQLITKTKNEIDKQMEEVNKRIENTSVRATGEIHKLETLINKNREESDEMGRRNKEENKQAMEIILSNQQTMMNVLLQRMDSLNTEIKVRNSAQYRNEIGEIEIQTDSKEGDKENISSKNYHQNVNVHAQRYSEGIATPPEFNKGQGKYWKPMTGQQQ
jgi:hypothetical protein